MRFVVSASCLLLGLGGCDRAEPSPLAPVFVSAPKVEAPVEFDFWEKPKHRFAVAGVRDPGDVLAFVESLREVVRSKNRAAFAEMVQYPFHTYVRGRVKLVCRTKAEFLRSFDRIVTSRVLKAVEEQRYDDLFCNCQGVMIGNGEVWFGTVGFPDAENGILRIRAINGDWPSLPGRTAKVK